MYLEEDVVYMRDLDIETYGRNFLLLFWASSQATVFCSESSFTRKLD